MVSAALPEATAESFDVADPFVLVGKVHFPDEGAVTEDPHDSNNAHCRGNKRSGSQPNGGLLEKSTPAKKKEETYKKYIQMFN